jgi:hypothetical protein
MATQKACNGPRTDCAREISCALDQSTEGISSARNGGRVQMTGGAGGGGGAGTTTGGHGTTMKTLMLSGGELPFPAGAGIGNLPQLAT